MKESSSAKRQFSTLQTFELYSTSEFCMHPPGDSMVRKGIVDSLLVGCIPVLFEEKQVGIWPWHWGDWKSSSLVFLHKDSQYDPVEALSQIPLETRNKMRASIAANAHMMQYAKDEPPVDKPDAWNVLVDHVKMGENDSHAQKAFDDVVSRFEKILMRLEDDGKTKFEHEKDESVFLSRDMPMIVGHKRPGFHIKLEKE